MFVVKLKIKVKEKESVCNLLEKNLFTLLMINHINSVTTQLFNVKYQEHGHLSHPCAPNLPNLAVNGGLRCTRCHVAPPHAP